MPLAVAMAGMRGYRGTVDPEGPDAALLFVDGAVCHDQCLYADEWSTFHALRAEAAAEVGTSAAAPEAGWVRASAWEAAHDEVARHARFASEPARVAPSLLEQALAWAQGDSWRGADAGGGATCARRQVRWGPGSGHRGWAGPLALVRGMVAGCAASAYDGEDAEPCLPLRCHVCGALTRPANAAVCDGEGGGASGAAHPTALMPTVLTGTGAARWGEGTTGGVHLLIHASQATTSSAGRWSMCAADAGACRAGRF